VYIRTPAGTSAVGEGREARRSMKERGGRRVRASRGRNPDQPEKRKGKQTNENTLNDWGSSILVCIKTTINYVRA